MDTSSRKKLLYAVACLRSCFVENRRYALQITLLVCALTYVMLGSANIISYVFLYRVILGIFSQTQALCGPMLVETLLPQEKAEMQKFMTTVGTTSLIAAASVAGHILEMRNGFRYVCSFISIIYLLNYGIVYFFLQNTPHVPKKEKNDTATEEQLSNSKGKNQKGKEKDEKQLKEINTKASVKSVLLKYVQSVTELRDVNWELYWDVYALQFLFDFALTVHLQNFPPVLRDVYNTAPRWIGYTAAMQGAAIVMFGFLSGWINSFYKYDTNHIQKTYHGFGMYVLSFLCLSFAPNWNYIFVCLLPLSASISVLRSTILELIKQRSLHDKKKQVVDAEKSVSSAARLCAPLVLGLVYDNYGFPGTSILKIITAGTATVITAKLFNSQGKDEKKTD
ncbi:major facilitator superfamily domain-containing protein 9-like isoform X2 [Periplaneta americana]|uniref:major facilitator superfamily domain-containing protein 9-like isoform X2 n=1 Tax=Periplaneta americana TaxID=6978 RepID=UPI0037E7CF05